MANLNYKNKIIVAPLNWGWGHASRCIPIIKEIMVLGYIPVIACDGSALDFLQKEFPNMETLELPTYGIKYHQYFVWSMCLNIPKIVNGIIKEQAVIKKYITEHKKEIVGIISDNRLGIYHSEIPSVYITHQLNIKAGILSKGINKIHHYFIKKHQECWVPDEENSLYSGDLSKNTSNLNIQYIGVLSRFKKQEIPTKYNLLVLLSGVEGQRKALEDLMFKELKYFKGKILLVRGTLNASTKVFPSNVVVVDYLLSKDLEKAINASDLVISRSGYSTIMDLVILEKRAFYIPTPGQTEQEYLASYLQRSNIANFSTQKEFTIDLLNKKNVEGSFKKTSQHCISEYLIKAFKLSPM
ncbi:glycosyltransferase [Wenyingzhuangia marina]|uniref:UDP-N-acetylglucosamine:LPS N-acetylglucosamine transferase n=1 Tax=Wenyingzhuangia marina TaxID=1195760 RepID=A0A1M5SWX5_9FLAO|nr:glycosyltransferase [Wenyingzhuangia marina]GGF64285.1 glycosyl transferase [Wenyingzhuangia marina]SHH42583.1 UDP-N-acetylglucosamine:LPS N-acetylglucosamine transferase [Wenyingzhuangia marina]